MKKSFPTLFFAVVCCSLFLAACEPSDVVSDNKTTERGRRQSSTHSDVKTSAQNAVQSDDKAKNHEAASKIFIATLKKPEPVPEALSTGMLKIVDNCLVVVIKNQPNKFYTAVLPHKHDKNLNNGVINIGKKKISLNKNTSIPGGAIFLDRKKYFDGEIPSECSSDLFGIGE